MHALYDIRIHKLRICVNFRMFTDIISKPLLNCVCDDRSDIIINYMHNLSCFNGYFACIFLNVMIDYCLPPLDRSLATTESREALDIFNPRTFLELFLFTACDSFYSGHE